MLRHEMTIVDRAHAFIWLDIARYLIMDGVMRKTVYNIILLYTRFVRQHVLAHSLQSYYCIMYGYTQHLYKLVNNIIYHSIFCRYDAIVYSYETREIYN